MSGLGLEEFLSHGESRGKKRKFLDWKKNGSVVVWLSTRSGIAYPAWAHPFNYVGTFKDKEGEEHEALRFTRFASPDPAIVHENQYFRVDKDDPMSPLQTPPEKDPFLLLREWLRLECEEPLDAVVFEWEGKDGKPIKWRRGTLARLVEKTKTTWSHTLDTKLEYLFVVVDDSAPGDGPQIVRGTKALAEKMQNCIRHEMDSNGDEGNPKLHPYAFKWRYDPDAASFNDQYSAFRFNKAKLTDAIRDAITEENFPDPSVDQKPKPGDKARIRAAMTAAAQIDIPWDRIFVDEWVDEAKDDTSFDYGANQKKRASEVSTKSNGASRRKKVEAKTAKPKEKKVEPETVPCDECEAAMAPTDTKCSNCGAEYEVDGESAPPAKAEAKKSANKSETKCFSCGGPVADDVCQKCGLEVSDDFPY